MIHYLVEITVTQRTKEGSLYKEEKTYVVDANDGQQLIGMDIMRLVLSHNCLVKVVNVDPDVYDFRIYRENEFYNAALSNLV